MNDAARVALRILEAVRRVDACARVRDDAQGHGRAPGPRRSRRRAAAVISAPSDSPSTYSMTRYSIESASPRSNTWATFGCSMTAAIRASSRNMLRNAGIVREAIVDALEGEQLLEAVLAPLACDPHVSHAALTDGGDELVAVDQRPGGELAARPEIAGSASPVVVISVADESGRRHHARLDGVGPRRRLAAHHRHRSHQPPAPRQARRLPADRAGDEEQRALHRRDDRGRLPPVVRGGALRVDAQQVLQRLSQDAGRSAARVHVRHHPRPEGRRRNRRHRPARARAAALAAPTRRRAPGAAHRPGHGAARRSDRRSPARPRPEPLPRADLAGRRGAHRARGGRPREARPRPEGRRDDHGDDPERSGRRSRAHASVRDSRRRTRSIRRRRCGRSSTR